MAEEEDEEGENGTEMQDQNDLNSFNQASNPFSATQKFTPSHSFIMDGPPQP